MKSFFELFTVSARNFRNLRCVVVTGMLIALSAALEGLSIDIPFAKINFAYIAIAAIGMLFGPAVGFSAACICDVIGFMVHPQGSFLPVYTLIAGVQGLIYGIVLFKCRDGEQVWFDVLSAKNSSDNEDRTQNGKLSELAVRIVIARLLDVIIINLICNTTANYYYHFITADTLPAAIKIRIGKNLLQLAADIPILLAVLPAVLAVYRTTFGRVSSRKA